VTASHRSIHPNIPGVPWWAAVVIAVTSTAVGFAFDAGSANKELTDVFSALYVLGCVVAVLAVRQSGIFTAVIQPPLILFCAVPGAYWLLHGARIRGLKDLLINCGYPLIERFPLMLLTSAGVLLIGMIRWYVGMAARSSGAATAESEDTGEPGKGIVARLAALIGREPAEPTHTEKADRAKAARARRSDAAGRRTRSGESTGARSARRPDATRSRRVRPALDDLAEPAPDRTRRRRPTQPRQADPDEPNRRNRLPRDPDLRARPPREVRRDPHVRRSRSTTRSSRFDPYEPIEPYEPAEPPARPHRRAAPTGTTATHHPISRVRYRGAAPADDGQPLPRSREPRKPWE
jgi:hypothetical protein